MSRTDDVSVYARIGIQQRLVQLSDETTELRALLAELNGHGGARQAAAPKARRRKRKAAPAAPVKTTRGTPGGKWGTILWQRIHDFLKTQDKGTADLAAIVKGAKANTVPSAISAIKIHPELFKKTGSGQYTLITKTNGD